MHLQSFPSSSISLDIWPSIFGFISLAFLDFPIRSYYLRRDPYTTFYNCGKGSLSLKDTNAHMLLTNNYSTEQKRTGKRTIKGQSKNNKPIHRNEPKESTTFSITAAQPLILLNIIPTYGNVCLFLRLMYAVSR